MPSVHIDARGYGKIYKAVMRNRSLPLVAKAVYAYFCTYAGSGTTAFPQRDKIIRDLQINKDTFTKHLGFLVEQGYISKQRSRRGNIYTIVQQVPGYAREPPVDNEADTDMLVFENIKRQGYGTVPKLVMLDRALSAQAKAIYAYFASFAGAGTTAFPRRTTVMRELGMTDKTYYKHFNQLLDAGYVSVEQRKVQGKFSISLYRLADTVERPSPAVKKPLSEKLPNGENSQYDGNSGMSENLPNGGKPGDMSEKLLSGKLPSEKLQSEEIPMEESGHADTRNSSITNSSDKEQVQYHQGMEEGDASLSFSLDEAKKLVHHDHLLREALAWGELKEMLGHYKAPGDKKRYMVRAVQILDVLAALIRDRLNLTERPGELLPVFVGAEFEAMVDELLNHWESMRSIAPYVENSLENYLRERQESC